MIRLLNEKDRGILLDYVERNHIECTFHIGNIKQFGIENNSGIRRSGDYFGYFEGKELKGIIAFYNLGSCIPHFESDGAIEGFVELMKGRQFTDLLGMKKYVFPLCQNILPYKKPKDMSEDSYFINKNFKPFDMPGVEFSEANDSILESAVNFMVEASLLGFKRKSTTEEKYTILKERSPEENYLFEINNGKIIAQACIQTATSKINQIGGVYTASDERGKGYCKAIVSKLCETIIGRGKMPTLMVRNNNTPAVMAYKAVGFEHYDDYMLVNF